MKIRSTHRYGFRSGEWAECLNRKPFNGRDCYYVRFPDGVTDIWVCDDPGNKYEFGESEAVKPHDHYIAAENELKLGGDPIKAIAHAILAQTAADTIRLVNAERERTANDERVKFV